MMKRIFFYSHNSSDRLLWKIVLGVVLLAGSLSLSAEEEGGHTKALLEKVREQYQRDVEAAKKKHLADSIMGNRWGELNAKDDIRFQLVRVHVEQEHYDDAMKLLAEIAVQSPDPKAKMRAFCTRGAVLELGLEKPREALKEYRKAIEVPNNHYVGITAGAYLAMAEIYLQIGDRTRAKLILEESYRSLSYTHVTNIPMAQELMETEK